VRLLSRTTLDSFPFPFALLGLELDFCRPRSLSISGSESDSRVLGVYQNAECCDNTGQYLHDCPWLGPVRHLLS
jgi:hypothetical protein